MKGQFKDGLISLLTVMLVGIFIMGVSFAGETQFEGGDGTRVLPTALGGGDQIKQVPPGSDIVRVMEVPPGANDFLFDLTLSYNDGAAPAPMWVSGASLVTITIDQPGGTDYVNVSNLSQILVNDGTTLRVSWDSAARPIATFSTATIEFDNLSFIDKNNALCFGNGIDLTVETFDAFITTNELDDGGAADTVANYFKGDPLCGPPPPTPPTTDHFLSYQIRHKAEVFLADQFIQGFFKIGEPVALLNPADKDGGGILDPFTHLISYKVKGPEFGKVENILVENQFGEFVVDVKKPDRLLVPASKSEDGPVSPPPPDNSTHDVDHFLCYQIEDDDDDNLGILISVVDQFNQPKLFNVRKPRRLCNPVDKNGEGIKDSQTHLMCFTVRRARGEPRHERIDGIFVNDQFGPGRVDTKKERELCVPSIKTLL